MITIEMPEIDCFGQLPMCLISMFRFRFSKTTATNAKSLRFYICWSLTTELPMITIEMLEINCFGQFPMCLISMLRVRFSKTTVTVSFLDVLRIWSLLKMESTVHSTCFASIIVAIVSIDITDTNIHEAMHDAMMWVLGWVANTRSPSACKGYI